MPHCAYPRAMSICRSTFGCSSCLGTRAQMWRQPMVAVCLKYQKRRELPSISRACQLYCNLRFFHSTSLDWYTFCPSRVQRVAAHHVVPDWRMIGVCDHLELFVATM